MKWILILSVACLSLVGANAFADVDFGGQVDWNKFSDVDGGDVGVGVRFEFGTSFRLIIPFDYYFVDTDILGNDNTPNNNFDLKFYELSGNLAYYFPTGTVRPYIGAGASLSKRTFNNVEAGNFFDDNKSELGLNILGGIKFNEGGPAEPFFEVRGVFYSGDETFNNRLVLTGGVVF